MVIRRFLCLLRGGHQYAATKSVRWYLDRKWYRSQRLICLRCHTDGMTALVEI